MGLRISAVGQVPRGASIRLFFFSPVPCQSPSQKFSFNSGSFSEESGIIQGRDTRLLFPEFFSYTDRFRDLTALPFGLTGYINSHS